MKKNFGIKLQLLGIGLIAFLPYALTFSDSNTETANIFQIAITSVGVTSPIIGLILCISGLFYKEK